MGHKGNKHKARDSGSSPMRPTRSLAEPFLDCDRVSGRSRPLLFRKLSPFWLFRDASRGDLLARAAAYRHNRDMRIYLPRYLLKWLAINAAGLATATGLASMSDGTADVFLILAASTGMLFASSVCMFVLIAYLYLYLSFKAY